MFISSLFNKLATSFFCQTIFSSRSKFSGFLKNFERPEKKTLILNINFQTTKRSHSVVIYNSHQLIQKKKLILLARAYSTAHVFV